MEMLSPVQYVFTLDFCFLGATKCPALQKSFESLSICSISYHQPGLFQSWTSQELSVRIQGKTLLRRCPWDKVLKSTSINKIEHLSELQLQYKIWKAFAYKSPPVAFTCWIFVLTVYDERFTGLSEKSNGAQLNRNMDKLLENMHYIFSYHTYINNIHKSLIFHHQLNLASLEVQMVVEYQRKGTFKACAPQTVSSKSCGI